MRLHDAKDGRVLRERAVSGSFDEVITISPVPDDYYLTIACDGVTQSFKSGPCGLGGRRRYDDPLNLGKIVLPRRSGTDPRLCVPRPVAPVQNVAVEGLQPRRQGDVVVGIAPDLRHRVGDNARL